MDFVGSAPRTINFENKFGPQCGPYMKTVSIKAFPNTMEITIQRSVPIARSPRVAQVEGLFDIPPAQRSERRWHHRLDLPDDWQIGVIVGPSGSGKTTLAREAFGDHIVEQWDWPAEKSILDGFPASMGIREIVELLCSVGFSSPPAWVR